MVAKVQIIGMGTRYGTHHFNQGSAIRSPLAQRAKKFTNDAIPIIDCHTHMWDLSAWNSPWLKKIPALNKNFGVKEHGEDIDMKLLDIRASVLVETDPIKNDFTKETKYMTSICENPANTFQKIIGSCDISSPLLPNHVNQFISGRSKPYYRGVRDVAHNKPKGYLTSTQAIDNYIYLGKEGLLYEVLMQPDDLMSMAPIIKACHKTTFVIDHCGGIQGLCGNKEKEDKWKKAIEALAKCDNAILKVSGLAGGWGGDARVDEHGWHWEFQRDYVEFAIGAFHANRQVFGLDWPVCRMIPGADLNKYVVEVDKIAKVIGRQMLSDKIFIGNAFKAYDINLEDTLTQYFDRNQVDKYSTQTRMDKKWDQPSMMDATLLDTYFHTATIGGGKKV